MKKFLDERHDHYVAAKNQLEAVMAKFVTDQQLASTFALTRLDIEVLRPRTLDDGRVVQDYELSGYFLYDGIVVRFQPEAHATAERGMWIESILYLKVGSEWIGTVYPLRNRQSPANWSLGFWGEAHAELVFQHRNEFLDFDVAVKAAA